MLTNDCIWFHFISMAKHRKLSRGLLWTMCAVAMRGFRNGRCILIRLSEIYLPDCLTKFDCDLITAEWPNVSVERIVQFLYLNKLKFKLSIELISHEFYASTSFNPDTAVTAVIFRFDNKVNDIEKKSMHKPQEIKNFLLTVVDALTRFYDVFKNDFYAKLSLTK